MYLHDLVHQCAVPRMQSPCGSGVVETQIALVAACRSAGLLGLMLLVFMLTATQRFLTGSRSGEFGSLLANQEQERHGHWTSLWYLWQCGQLSPVSAD